MSRVEVSRIEEGSMLAKTAASTEDDSEKLEPGAVRIPVGLVHASGVIGALVLLSRSVSCDTLHVMEQSQFGVSYLEWIKNFTVLDPKAPMEQCLSILMCLLDKICEHHTFSGSKSD